MYNAVREQGVAERSPDAVNHGSKGPVELGSRKILESVLSWGGADPHLKQADSPHMSQTPRPLSRSASNTRPSILSRSLTSSMPSEGSPTPRSHVSSPTRSNASPSSGGRVEARTPRSSSQRSVPGREIEKLQREMESLRVQLDEAHSAVEVRH